MLSAALSPNAFNGYVNSIKISPTEDKLVFLVFQEIGQCRYVLDTKPGFNRSDYGDETDATPSVRGFNYFNNPSILILISKLILSCYFNGRWGDKLLILSN
jgi:hypothetical protein